MWTGREADLGQGAQTLALALQETSRSGFCSVRLEMAHALPLQG